MSLTPSGLESNNIPGWRARTAALAATVLAVLLAACGSSSPGAPETPAGNGAALVTMQDAAGDFLSYTVDLVSLKLTKASGAQVETLPATARVDFAQLVDLSELVSAGQIPAGEYVAATLTVDYSNASITAEDATGSSLALSALDVSGHPLIATLELALQLDNRHHLLITPGRTARLAFDFNLAASNAVDLPSATVTVAPLIQASVVPPAELPIRVRGLLASTDAMASTYTVDVRPFHLGAGAAGQVVVHTTDATKYEIDGNSLSGAAGLAALAAEPAGTITVAFGALATSDFSFTAQRVLAGGSAEGGNIDRVRGVVIARSGDTLAVRGATLDRRDGSFEFMRGAVTVNVTAATKVTEEGATGSFGIGDISVGQRICAAGTVSVDSITGAAALDASTGRVRLEITPLWGMVSGAVGNPLTLDLRAIDGRNPALFDFSGTGASPATDANAGAYAVDTGILDLSALQSGEPARVFGFALPYGSALTSDFRAESLVSYGAVPTQLVLNWASGGSLGAFPGLTGASTTLDLDLTGAGALHFLQKGPVRINLLTLAAPPQITGDAMASATAYVVGHAHTRRSETYQSFADFIAALAGDLGGMTSTLGLAANGRYDAATDSFAADQLGVLLTD